jgi:chemotaxis protein MotB
VPIFKKLQQLNHEEIDTEGSWAISYGDMITLLMTFFVLFFSTNKELDRMKAMEKSLFTILKESTAPAQEVFNNAGIPTVPNEDLRQKLKAQVSSHGKKLYVEFPEVSFFDLSSYEITRTGREELAKFMKLYMPFAGNYIVGIRAYTDLVPVINRGPASKYKDNLELSALRAVAAVRNLREMGLPLNRMRIAGYGEIRLDPADLEKLELSDNSKSKKDLPMARKIVISIEPDVTEKL